MQEEEEKTYTVKLEEKSKQLRVFLIHLCITTEYQ